MMFASFCGYCFLHVEMAMQMLRYKCQQKHDEMCRKRDIHYEVYVKNTTNATNHTHFLIANLPPGFLAADVSTRGGRAKLQPCGENSVLAASICNINHVW